MDTPYQRPPLVFLNLGPDKVKLRDAWCWGHWPPCLHHTESQTQACLLGWSRSQSGNKQRHTQNESNCCPTDRAHFFLKPGVRTRLCPLSFSQTQLVWVAFCDFWPINKDNIITYTICKDLIFFLFSFVLLMVLQGSVAQESKIPLTYSNTWVKTDPTSHSPYRLRQKIPTSRIPSCNDTWYSFRIQNSQGNSVARDEWRFPQSLDLSSSPLGEKEKVTHHLDTLISKTDLQRGPTHHFRKAGRWHHHSWGLS